MAPKMIVLAAVSLLALWHTGLCEKVFKSTLTITNPKSLTVTEHVYFDVKVWNYEGTKEHLEGRFVVAVFGDALPMTVLNFVSLARGYMRGNDLLSYNNTYIHRVVPDFIVQMGDVEQKRGKGGTSIYGKTFRDEYFLISHSSSGIVSMANSGKDENNSQFFITLQKARYLDGHHVAFGKVISGMELIQKIGNLATTLNQSPRKIVRVMDCGVEGLYNKYEITGQQLETNSEEFVASDFYQGEEDEEGQ